MESNSVILKPFMSIRKDSSNCVQAVHDMEFLNSSSFNISMKDYYP